MQVLLLGLGSLPHHFSGALPRGVLAASELPSSQTVLAQSLGIPAETVCSDPSFLSRFEAGQGLLSLGEFLPSSGFQAPLLCLKQPPPGFVPSWGSQGASTARWACGGLTLDRPSLFEEENCPFLGAAALRLFSLNSSSTSASQTFVRPCTQRTRKMA